MWLWPTLSEGTGPEPAESGLNVGHNHVRDAERRSWRVCVFHSHVRDAAGDGAVLEGAGAVARGIEPQCATIAAFGSPTGVSE